MEEFKDYMKCEKSLCEDIEKLKFDNFFFNNTDHLVIRDVLCDLAYQIMNLQVCVEGLIQDQDM